MTTEQRNELTELTEFLGLLTDLAAIEQKELWADSEKRQYLFIFDNKHMLPYCVSRGDMVWGEKLQAAVAPIIEEMRKHTKGRMQEIIEEA